VRASEPAFVFVRIHLYVGGCKNTTALGTVVGESQRMYPPTLFLKQKLTKNAMSVGLHGKEGTKKEGCIIMCTWLQWFVTS